MFDRLEGTEVSGEQKGKNGRTETKHTTVHTLSCQRDTIIYYLSISDVLNRIFIHILNIYFTS